jgi:uracil-DNA glycosylase
MAVVRLDSKECPECSMPLVDYGGSRKSDIMIIVGQADESDFESGKVLHGSWNKPLYQELSKRKIDMYSCSLVNYYPHEKPSTRTKIAREQWERCLKLSTDKLLKEADGKRFILCVGSEVTKFFLGYGDVTCSGIPLTSKFFSAEMVMGIQSIQYVSTNSCGEFCLALDRFSEEVFKRRKYGNNK